MSFPNHPTPHLYQHSMTDEMIGLFNKRDTDALRALVLQYSEEFKSGFGDDEKLALGRLLCAAGLLDSLRGGGKACMVLCDYVNF